MVKPLVLLLILLSPLTWASSMQSLESLSDLKWENRLILIDAGYDAKSYQHELIQHDAEINDRDIIWFIISQTALSSNFKGIITDNIAHEVHQKLHDNNSSILLIGKDGGIKATENTLRLDVLFSKIDRMPMRQRELQYH